MVSEQKNGVEPACRTADIVKEVSKSNFNFKKFYNLHKMWPDHKGRPNYDGNEVARKCVAKLMENCSSEHSAAHHYCPTKGHPTLRASLRNYYERCYDWKLGENEVAVTTSGSEALFAICQAFVNPGDEVIYFEPFFPWYARCVTFAGGKNVVAPLKQDSNGSMRPDFVELEKRVTDKTKAIIWNTPHNPSGFVATEEEVKALCEICIKHDLMLVSDEVYEGHVFPNCKTEHLRAATFPGMHQRTVTVGSASKLFSLTGWRIGWVLGPAELLQPMDVVHATMSFCAPTPLQIGVAAAFDAKNKGDVEPVAYLLEENCKDLCGAFTKLGLKPLPAQGAQFITVDITGVDMDECQFAEELAKHGLVAYPMEWFIASKDPGTPSIRIALCKRREDIVNAVKSLAEVDFLSHNKTKKAEE